MVALSYTHKYIFHTTPHLYALFLLRLSPSSSSSFSLFCCSRRRRRFFFHSQQYKLNAVHRLLFYAMPCRAMLCFVRCWYFFYIFRSFSVWFGFGFCFRFFPVFIIFFFCLFCSFNDYILWFVIHSETGDSHNNKAKKERKREKKEKYDKNFLFPISLFVYIRCLLYVYGFLRLLAVIRSMPIPLTHSAVVGFVTLFFFYFAYSLDYLFVNLSSVYIFACSGCKTRKWDGMPFHMYACIV